MSTSCQLGRLAMAGAAVVALAMGYFVGCKRASTPPAPGSQDDPKQWMQWARYWDGLKQRSTSYGLGTEFELLEIEQTPYGLKQTTVVWVIMQKWSEGANFEVRRNGTRRQENHVDFHPHLRVPAGFVDGQDPLVTVSTPAGDFRCARVSLDQLRKGGVEVDLIRDEWRAPNVPVPIQAWERPRAMVEGELRDPPQDPAAMPLGCTFSRLVAVRPGMP